MSNGYSRAASHLGLALFSCIAAASIAGAATLDTSAAGEAAFREIYKELVDTNTTLSAGSCTRAAEQLAGRLRLAGYTDAEMHLFAEPDHPQEGGLVAQLTGSDPRLKAILLLAHLDVVEANPADWTRDPFRLIEEGGYFYARGAADDKAMAAIFADLLIRLRKEGFHPARTIRLALTCGEETNGAFNGASYLATHHKDWIDAQFALNEGGSPSLDANGKPQAFSVLAAEKVFQNYTLETRSPGGHSSQPVPDNAIYRMASALEHLRTLEFPVQITPTTRGYFATMADIVGGDTGEAMRTLLRDPANAGADAIVSADKKWHSMLRTTCVATLISGGHASNALPQRVTTTVNCRILPGISVESVRDALVEVIDDPGVQVRIQEPRSPATATPPFDASLMMAIKTVAGQLYPGVPVLPTMNTGATDAVYLNAVGIPTYGVTGMFVDPDGGNIHGLNERIRVRSILDGRRFHYQLVKLLSQP